MKKIFVILTLLLPFCSFGQNSLILQLPFEKETDFGQSLNLFLNNDKIIVYTAGWDTIANRPCLKLSKYDTLGNHINTMTLSDSLIWAPNGSKDGILKTNSGNYFLTTSSFVTKKPYCFLVDSSLNNVLLRRKITFLDSTYNLFPYYSIECTDGYLISFAVQKKNTDGYLIGAILKIDKDGNKMWAKQYHLDWTGVHDVINNFIPIGGNKYLIQGLKYNRVSTNIQIAHKYFMTIDSLGNVLNE